VYGQGDESDTSLLIAALELEEVKSARATLHQVRMHMPTTWSGLVEEVHARGDHDDNAEMSKSLKALRTLVHAVPMTEKYDARTPLPRDVLRDVVMDIIPDYQATIAEKLGMKAKEAAPYLEELGRRKPYTLLALADLAQDCPPLPKKDGPTIGDSNPWERQAEYQHFSLLTLRDSIKEAKMSIHFTPQTKKFYNEFDATSMSGDSAFQSAVEGLQRKERVGSALKRVADALEYTMQVPVAPEQIMNHLKTLPPQKLDTLVEELDAHYTKGKNLTQLSKLADSMTATATPTKTTTPPLPASCSAMVLDALKGDKRFDNPGCQSAIKNLESGHPAFTAGLVVGMLQKLTLPADPKVAEQVVASCCKAAAMLGPRPEQVGLAPEKLLHEGKTLGELTAASLSATFKENTPFATTSIYKAANELQRTQDAKGAMAKLPQTGATTGKQPPSASAALGA
jgi:hypothetical protein